MMGGYWGYPLKGGLEHFSWRLRAAWGTTLALLWFPVVACTHHPSPHALHLGSGVASGPQAGVPRRSLLPLNAGTAELGVLTPEAVAYLLVNGLILGPLRALFNRGSATAELDAGTIPGFSFAFWSLIKDNLSETKAEKALWGRTWQSET